jgi:hypothetical protein
MPFSKIIADRAAKAAAWAAEGAASAWVGVEGDRIAFDLTVQHVVELEGMYGITYINICKDADENVVILQRFKLLGQRRASKDALPRSRSMASAMA